MSLYPITPLPYQPTMLYTRAGVVYPVIVFRPQPQQVNDPDSVLSPHPPTTITTGSGAFAFYDTAHLNALLAEKPGLYDGATYTMQYIETDPLTVHGGIGRYYDMLATCDALEQEVYQQSSDTLPLRAKLHSAISPQAALTDGRGRSASIGVSTLIVFNHDGDYQAILARRSRQTALHSGMYHVLPAFMLEPMGTNGFAADWCLTRQVERELLEEVFDVPENHAYDHHPALNDLRMMMSRGDAALYLTGVIMNLLTMRPEIGTLLLIHDRDWYPRMTAPDSPIPLRTAAETDGHTLVYPPITNDAAFLGSLPDDILSRMPVQAGAAMWLAIDRARDILNARHRQVL